MATPARLSAASSRRARESSRRRRSRDRKPHLKPHLKVESLEPRLALATGLLSTLVSVVRDDASHSLLAPGATTKIAEGEQLTASVRLTRKPDSAILVSFKNPAALEVGAPLTTLRFTRATWNQPQTVSFASLQDGSRDGDHVVPVKMKTAVARNPQSKATKTIRIESLDSGVVTPDSPVTATQKGSIFGGGNTGSVVGAYDAGKNLGTATFQVTMPGVKHVRNRTITVDYSVNPDSTVKVERLEGIPREKFRLDATHRRVGVDHGLFGTLTVMQPKLGQSATAMMTVAAVPDAVQNLAVTPTGVGSLLLSWNPPAGGATGYTVTINNGSTTTTSTTTATSMPFTGLSGAAFYTFTVVATNASGSGADSTTSFGPQTVAIGRGPVAFANGLDGSIWVANGASGTVQQLIRVDGIWTPQPAILVSKQPTSLTTGLDGSIWVSSSVTNTVQQISNIAGTWSAMPAISVAPNPVGLTTGLDGSIWVANANITSSKDGFVQQIVNVDGIWKAMPAIAVGPQPLYLTTGLDGSIWVSCSGYDNVRVGNTVQQVVNKNGVWAAQPPILVGSLPCGITTGLDGSIWVANAVSNTIQQIVDVSGEWTALPPIALAVDAGPAGLATGPNGSIWIANTDNTIQQILDDNGTWTLQPPLKSAPGPIGLLFANDGSLWVDTPTRVVGPDITVSYSLPMFLYVVVGGVTITLPQLGWANTVSQFVAPPPQPTGMSARFGPGLGEMTLDWSPLPDAIPPVLFYTATASQGATTQTITSSSTSCTFSGLTLGQGTTYFTLTASNFVGVSQTASVWLGPDGIPLDTTNLGVGIVTDGTPFTGGGFDGDGNAYSWQALGSSPTLAWNGVTFDLGSPNQPDCTVANGQTIAVPQGAYTTLNLAGAAVNGSQTNQQITLTFTDSSTVTWTQSFSDWGSPQNYGHEAIISTQSYRDTASGGTDQFTNHVYGYSYTIPTGKTLASITLPTNSDVRLLDIQMSTATSVDLSGAYSSWGIANGSTQVANHQGFDGGGYYYYSAQLGPLVAWSGATFNFGTVPTSSKGTNNFVQAKGQAISLPQGNYGWLYLAGAGANGGQTNQKLTLTFTDDSTATWIQSFSDWCSSSGYAGETIIQQQSSRVNQVGNVHSQTNYVYGYAYQIPAGKILKSVTLPDNTNNLGILGIAMM